MVKEELKTSSKWYEECKYVIISPDGWDGKNFQYSWFKETITLKEFNNMLNMSVVRTKTPEDVLVDIMEKERDGIVMRSIEASIRLGIISKTEFKTFLDSKFERG